MGEWMSEGGTGTPHYVINPDHVQRLLREGYQIIADPRVSTEAEQSSEAESEPEKDELEDDDTTRRLTATKPTKGARTRDVDATSR